MKKSILLLAAFLFTFILSACGPLDKSDEPAQVSKKTMTEEEKEAARTADMIKLIEKEEARMKAAGEIK